MLEHTLGRTGRTVSAIGLGTWQLGADWGDVTEADAFEVLDAAAADGVTFFDTADVYGDGRSESIIGAWRAGNPGVDVTVATKMVRRADVPDSAALTRANIVTSARGLDKTTIAEFVSDAGSMTVLFSIGVDLVQGNFLAPPMAAMSYEFG